MDGPPAQEAIQQLEELTLAIEDLRRRVSALEQRSAVASPNVELSVPAGIEPTALPGGSSGLLAQLGRLLLGIAGAYLLRAITEAGILPELTGTLIGLIYAGGWLVASLRSAAANRITLALEGLTASAIAAPLLWEATTRFHAIAPSGAAAALACFIILGQIVAWKHGHSAIAAITAFAGSITAIALIIATLDPVAFAIALLVSAVVVEYGAVLDHALAWRWIIALAADFCAFLLLYLMTRPQGLPEGYAAVPAIAVIAVQVALAAIYVSSAAARTLIRARCISWFEVLQTAVVVGLAIAGNLRPSVGIGLIIAAAACYLAASTGRVRKTDSNFQAYATFALIFAIAGSFLLGEALVLAIMVSAMAVLAIWFGERQDSTTYKMHAAIYLMAAAAAFFQAGRFWPLAAASAVVYGIVLSVRRKQEAFQRVPAAVVAAVLAGSVYATAAANLIALRLDPSITSTMGTALISVMALALGWLGKNRNLPELIWVLYPWMIFGAAKLLAEDFREGRSATLFVSLVVYGGTLIALPRLLRRAGK